MSLLEQSRPIYFFAFALACVAWAWIGPLGWPLTIAFVITALAWTWLVRKGFSNTSITQRIHALSALWFTLGAILVSATLLGLKVRGEV